MRDHKFTIPIGGSVQREGQFDFLRIVDCDGVLSLEFPTDQKELSEFAKGDYLGFQKPQREFIAQNRTDAELTVWIKTSAEATLQSALLVGDVNIVGVNQDSNDEPLVVREGRGLDLASIFHETFNVVLPAPPGGGGGLYEVKNIAASTWGNAAFIHVTNNGNIPWGSGQQFVDKNIALVIDDNGILVPWLWIEPAETVRIPAPDDDIKIAVITYGSDHNNNAYGQVTVVPELR